MSREMRGKYASVELGLSRFDDMSLSFDDDDVEAEAERVAAVRMHHDDHDNDDDGRRHAHDAQRHVPGGMPRARSGSGSPSSRWQRVPSSSSSVDSGGSSSAHSFGSASSSASSSSSGHWSQKLPKGSAMKYFPYFGAHSTSSRSPHSHAGAAAGGGYRYLQQQDARDDGAAASNDDTDDVRGVQLNPMTTASSVS